jgi:predicted ATPase
LGQGLDVLSEGAKDENITLRITENENEFTWICKVLSGASQLEFSEFPDAYSGFATSHLFQYLQADRIVPRTLYPQADQHSQQIGFLGSHGEFTADFLARNSDMIVREKRLFHKDCNSLDEAMWAKIAPTTRLLDQLAGWLQQISPGVRLRSELLKGTDEVILQFQYIGREHGLEPNFYRPTNVGFGITYSLPILVACLAAEPGTLLLLENPEAHLHPQGQAKLGELLAICAADEVQIIVETHSDHVLNGIRLAIKNNHIESSKVNIFYFSRDILSGDCIVEQPSILPDGTLSNWPDGFFDQWGKSLDALLG